MRIVMKVLLRIKWDATTTNSTIPWNMEVQVQCCLYGLKCDLRVKRFNISVRSRFYSVADIPGNKQAIISLWLEFDLFNIGQCFNHIILQ